ncbi:MAG: Na+/H+ antiporter NhaC family protein [Wenzhouxiangellaceae bacterium]
MTNSARKLIVFAVALAWCTPLIAQQAAPSHAGWVSLLPPLIAIGLALIIRQVLPALFAGIWIGAWATLDFSAAGSVQALLISADRYLIESLAEPDHASVILFTALVGGMVGVISKNGGMLGIVERIIHYADSTRRAAVATVAMGLAIFFDDYANTLVVGNTMRPITDRMRISREKLAYLVDSTAAPVACIGLVTTWVGYEVGLVRDALAGIDGLDLNPYLVFLNSIAYSFYPLLALVLVAAVAWTGRDFGPMREAERRAREQGQVAPPTAASTLSSGELAELEPEAGLNFRAINAVIPILVLIGGVIVGMAVTGSGDTLRDIVGSADPYKSLIWGSLLGSVVAIAMTLAQRLMTIEAVFAAFFAGIRSMLYAIVILVLAWALSGVTETLGTAHFLVELVGDHLHPGLLPALVFVLAAATAFSTGSSWGTMGILLPLMVPLAWALMTASGMNGAEHLHLLYATVAAVMGGAVWGDHSSPISDTTILSSLASQCDHIEHVRTQLPYALLAGLTALLLGMLPAGFGAPWWLCLPLAAGVTLALLMWLGRRQTV